MLSVNKPLLNTDVLLHINYESELMKCLIVSVLRQALCVLLLVLQIKGINSLINSEIQSKNIIRRSKGGGSGMTVSRKAQYKKRLGEQ